MCSASPATRLALVAGWLLAASVVTGVMGCGSVVPAGGVPKGEGSGAAASAGPRRTFEATDLIPQDLDLVIRVDLAKVRDALGPEPSKELMGRAIEEAGTEGIVHQALAEADAVWLGLRLADFETGDRVMVVRAHDEPVKPDSIAWTHRSSVVEGVQIYEPKVAPARSGTGRIIRVGKREAVFVSPVEVASVDRVLRRGPDPERGQPEARGLMSLDYRGRRLSPGLENRFPSLASLVAGVERVSASIEVTGHRLELEGRIRCKTPKAAIKVIQFLETIRTVGGRNERHRELLEALRLERSAATVQVRWRLPREAVILLLTPTGETEPPPGPQPPPPGAPSPDPPDANQPEPRQEGGPHPKDGD
ncbi:MAG: hypothetical protein JRI68_29630 [Deltaproteobacteria bacterium]|nr:hypothetical protein [Deltaproteobacteria bacterium]